MSTRQDRAKHALDCLNTAMEERPPACDGIGAFTANYLPPADRKTLADICAHCDLQLLCRQYVDTGKPPVGFWAGHYYGPKTRPKGT